MIKQIHLIKQLSKLQLKLKTITIKLHYFLKNQ